MILLKRFFVWTWLQKEVKYGGRKKEKYKKWYVNQITKLNYWDEKRWL